MEPKKFKPGDRLAVLVEFVKYWNVDYDREDEDGLFGLGRLFTAGSTAYWMEIPEDGLKPEGLVIIEVSDRLTPAGNTVWKLVEATD